MEWMMDLKSKFCMVRDRMLDTCTGTFVPAKSCSQLPKHGRFFDREKHYACFYDVLPSLVGFYGKQFSSASYNIAECDEVI